MNTGTKPAGTRKHLVFFAAALLILAAMLSRWTVHALLIEQMPEARAVFLKQVRPGDTLGLGFLHSVEHCRVWDFLKVEADYGLAVVATEFSESRTGLPYAAFEGEVFQRKGKGFRIGNMHRPVPAIWQWVNAEYENTLQINGSQAIRLASLAGDTLLHIHIAEINALEWAGLKVAIFLKHRNF